MTPYSYKEHRNLLAAAVFAAVKERLGQGEIMDKLACWKISDAIDDAYWAGRNDGIEQMAAGYAENRRATAQGSL
jgi:hypothetical protein